MRSHLSRHKHWYATAGFLMFLSGCAGAVTQTTKQLTDSASTVANGAKELSKDALLPITAPLKALPKAKADINTLKKQQDAHLQEMEDIK